jgi:hypothetical protein
MLRSSLRFFLPLLALFLIACGDETGTTDRPSIQVTPDDLTFQFQGAGRCDFQTINIENQGEADLVVRDIELNAQPSGVLSTEVVTPLTIAPGERTQVEFAYCPTDSTPLEGNIILDNNAEGRTAVGLGGEGSTPRPEFFPPSLDFGTVPETTSNTLSRELRNIGTAPLVICSVQLVGGSGLFATDLEEALEEAMVASIGFPVIDSQSAPFGVGVDSVPHEFVYAPSRPSDGDSAELSIVFDVTANLDAPCAESAQETQTFELRGRAVVGDLEVIPCPLEFGDSGLNVTHRQTVTMSNVEDLEVEVRDIYFEATGEQTDGVFLIEGLPSFPLPLDDSTTATDFQVGFRPDQERSYATRLVIDYINSRGEPELQECVISGTGLDNCAPTAVAEGLIREDSQARRGTEIEWAIPLQTVILDGSRSFDPCGEEVVDWQWDLIDAPDGAITSVQQPAINPVDGISEAFLPIAGIYIFELTVFDEFGLASEPQRVTVVAIPDEAISVELVWRTPNDPDESDEDGSDVDLHVTRFGNAWFDPTYDVFYANIAPRWEPEEPSLDRDDTNGGGPETFNLDNPAACQWYAVGVHYFREAFGNAYGSVNVFVNGQIVDEFVNQPLRETDIFWDVARIHWPSGTVVRVNEIIEGFDSTASIAPLANSAMQNSGLCGI